MSSRYFLTGLGISVSTDRRSTGGDQSVGSEGLILHFISASVFKFIQMCYSETLTYLYVEPFCVMR